MTDSDLEAESRELRRAVGAVGSALKGDLAYMTSLIDEFGKAEAADSEHALFDIGESLRTIGGRLTRVGDRLKGVTWHSARVSLLQIQKDLEDRDWWLCDDIAPKCQAVVYCFNGRSVP